MGNFSDIYGYETIKEHLQSAISMGKVSHAYVISGGLGSGKKLIASTFAQTLQCEAGGVEPCGVCHSCVQAAGRNQPDIIWVGHEKPGSIGVDDIRDQLVSDMQIKPYSSPYKIYIIDEADKLTVAAQNAMLKTIEEPPAYGIVILLANNPDVFLQTILSRCVVLDLKPLKDDVVIKYLKDHYDNEKNIFRYVETEDLRNFGMIPEFLGRLPIVFTLDALDEKMLTRILSEPKNALLKQYRELLAMDEVDLIFEPDALEAIAAKALKKDTGARALRAIIEDFMLDIMYEIPKDDNIGRVRITRAYVEHTGGPVIELRGQEPLILASEN